MEYREDPRRCRVARQRTNEKTGRVAQRGKQARADSTRELAEWGGCAGNDGHCRTQSDWAVLAIGGTAGAVQSTPLIPWCDKCLGVMRVH